MRRPHRSLVLVPTARILTHDLREAHAPGSMVELEALEEALVARGGRLVRKQARATASKREDAATKLPAAPSVGEPKAFLAGAKRWNEVRICLVNQALIRVDLPGRSVRCTSADLGMVHPRTRKPTASWAVLVRLCEDEGYFKTTRYGSVAATKKAISRLRGKLHELFDIKAKPFDRYLTGTGWKARFVAQGSVPDDFRGGGRRARLRGSVGDKSGGPAEDDVDFLSDDPNSWNA
jgi:hypothetical protein